MLICCYTGKESILNVQKNKVLTIRSQVLWLSEENNNLHTFPHHSGPQTFHQSVMPWAHAPVTYGGDTLIDGWMSGLINSNETF